MFKTAIVCGFRHIWRIVKLSIPHSWGKIKMSFSTSGRKGVTKCYALFGTCADEVSLIYTHAQKWARWVDLTDIPLWRADSLILLIGWVCKKNIQMDGKKPLHGLRRISHGCVDVFQMRLKHIVDANKMGSGRRKSELPRIPRQLFPKWKMLK